MRVTYRLDGGDRNKLRDAYIQEQLALSGGYMTREQATQAMRHYSNVVQQMLDKYDVDIEEEFEIDMHTGVIVEGT